MFRWYHILLSFLLITNSVSAQPKQIGLVLDGPWTRNDEFVSVFKQEIQSLLAGEFEAAFIQVEGDWTVGGVKKKIDGLLDDSSVHMVIAMGVLASQDVIHRKVLKKPVIAPFVLNHDLQDAPLGDGASGVENLSYVAFPTKAGHDIRIFRQVVPFKRLAFLYREVILEALPSLKTRLLEEVSDTDFSLVFIPVGDDVTTALDRLKKEVDAVFIAPMVGVSDGAINHLIEEINKMKLPSFSGMGTSEVDRGVLVGVSSDFNIPRLARRVALNVQRTFLGEDPGTFQVMFSRGEQLTLNMATARAIGVYPSWEILTDAVLVQDEREDRATLNLVEAVKAAVDANRTLQAQTFEMEAGAEELGKARAILLPQIEVGAVGAFIDSDLGSAQQAEKSVSGTITATQVLFSEKAWGNVHIQRSIQESREALVQQVRLDVAKEATKAFLDVLRAKTGERIQKENLRVSRSNLELARVRQSVGFSGPGEVYRWESQIASDQKAVISANAKRNLAEINLNRILHRPLEMDFDTREIGLDDPKLMQGISRLFPYISNPWHFKLFRLFMVDEGVLKSPEINQIDAAVAVQERALNSARRQFFAPIVAAQGEVKHSLSRSGAGASLPQLGGDRTWSVGVNASLPLFEGGARFADVKQNKLKLMQLQVQRESVVEQIEQRIRSGIHVMGASFAGIQLSKNAADAAQQNLELITDAYSRGVVSVLDLLDAQNAARITDEAAANAVYDFLIDVSEVERAVGKSSVLASRNELDAYFGRLDAYFKAQGVDVRN